VRVSWRHLPLCPTPRAIASTRTNAWAKGKATRPLTLGPRARRQGPYAVSGRQPRRSASLRRAAAVVLTSACQRACTLLASPLLPAAYAA
jgi:hypothetical protein